jgi:hypothetical protein
VIGTDRTVSGRRGGHCAPAVLVRRFPQPGHPGRQVLETPVLGSLAAALWGARRPGIHHLAPGLVARRSASEGFGVFVDRPVLAGGLLCVWGGEVVPTWRMLNLPEGRRRFAVQVEEDLYLVTPLLGTGAADLVNHSCDPTAILRGSHTLVARRDLVAGEEITYDYATSDANPHLGFVCRCGTAACRGSVSGDDWRDPELQARYGTAFSPHILRRILAESSSGLQEPARNSTPLG